MGQLLGGTDCITEVSDSNGHFRVEGINPGQVRIAVIKNGLSAHTGVLDLNSGENPAIRVTLASCAMVRGLVSFTSGEPVKGALLSAQPRQINLSELRFDVRSLTEKWAVAHTLSSEGGQFQLECSLSGPVWLTACCWSDDGALAGVIQERVTVEPGQVLNWNPVLERTGNILVRVFEANGSVRDAADSVVAVPTDAATDASRPCMTLRKRDHRGYFYEIGPCRITRHMVTMPCRRDEGEVLWVVQDGIVPDGDEVKLTFPPGYDRSAPIAIVGQVRNISEDVDLGEGWRLCVTSRSTVAVAKISDTGAFRATIDGPGRYQMFLQRGIEVRAVSDWFDVPRTKVWDFGDFRIEPGGSVEVECSAALEEAGMHVTIGDGFREKPIGLVGPGLFGAAAVQPGRYRINLYSSTWWINDIDIDIVAGQLKRVSLDPKRGESRGLVLWMPAPMNWSTASIWIEDTGGRRLRSVGSYFSHELKWDPVGWRGCMPLADAVLVVVLDGGSRRERNLGWATVGSDEAVHINMR